MTPNAAKLKSICENKGPLPVLFVSDPKNGDRFEFGTQEELLNEAEVRSKDEEVSVVLTDTHEVRLWADWEAWEGDHPHVLL